MSDANPQSSPATPAPTKPIVKLLVAALIVLGIAAGAAVWWISHRDAPARRVAELFIREMDKGDLTAAKSLCVPDIDVAQMQRLSDRMVREWGEIQLLDLSGIIRHTEPDGSIRTDVAGQLEYQNDLRKAFTATIVQQPDGSLKISAYKFE